METYKSGTIVYPGTFDCVTNAHLRLMQIGGRLFSGDFYVLVATKAGKNPWFSLDERVQMINDCLDKDYVDTDNQGNHWINPIPEAQRIKVIPVTNTKYVPDVMKELRAKFVLRGLRDANDFGYEQRLMRFYRIVNPEITPIYIPSFPEQHDDLTSSSAVKELVGPAGWIELIGRFLPLPIHGRFVERANEKLLEGK